MKLIAANDHAVCANDQNSIELTNDADPRDVSLEGVARVQLNFPKFSDGRADETLRPSGAALHSTARHPREQAKKLFPSRDFH